MRSYEGRRVLHPPTYHRAPIATTCVHLTPSRAGLLWVGLRLVVESETIDPIRTLEPRTEERDLPQIYLGNNFLPDRQCYRQLHNVSHDNSTRVMVMLKSAAGTGTSIVTTRQRQKPKLMLIKYDPKVNQHVLFVENRKIRSM
ncbi:uncharacterized protein [Diadema setosum]|uniref:uncharacterized protein n=1 Tax=Diadema setosum TaxID=31175 RepID=UPI003B3BB192